MRIAKLDASETQTYPKWWSDKVDKFSKNWMAAILLKVGVHSCEMRRYFSFNLPLKNATLKRFNNKC